jgi:hypothetical protein
MNRSSRAIALVAGVVLGLVGIAVSATSLRWQAIDAAAEVDNAQAMANLDVLQRVEKAVGSAQAGFWTYVSSADATVRHQAETQIRDAAESWRRALRDYRPSRGDGEDARLLEADWLALEQGDRQMREILAGAGDGGHATALAQIEVLREWAATPQDAVRNHIAFNGNRGTRAAVSAERALRWSHLVLDLSALVLLVALGGIGALGVRRVSVRPPNSGVREF